jgi:hypothetical protein
MSFRKSLIGASLAASCLLGSLTGSSAGGQGDESSQPMARLALLQLQEDFHAASTLGDQTLMESIWAEDGVFSNPAMTINGRSAIVAFFMSSPGWGVTASLVPSYKTVMDIQGNTATMHFECVILTVGGNDPLTVPFSTIPFGSQNPAVEVVQHSNASITAVKRGNRWYIHTFNGGAGAI